MIARHRVAIAGLVLNELSGEPIAGVHLQIADKPQAFADKLALLEKALAGTGVDPKRADSTRTRADGLFYFLDLPVGKYKLVGFVPVPGMLSRQSRRLMNAPDELFQRAGDKRYGRTEFEAQVSYVPEGFSNFRVIRIPLTGVTGRIVTSKNKTALPMAEVRLAASGERRFTDAQGRYTFTGIYPNSGRKRILQVSASGFRDHLLEVMIDEPGVCKEVQDIHLVREGGFKDPSI
jgi:hypothetical protein